MADAGTEGTPSASSPAPPTLGGHMPALDGVRGFAILIVLLYHFVAQTTVTNHLEAVINWVLGFGFLGVNLFFLLSGFLITGILYDSRDDRRYFRNFYMRRVLRIFPLYYAVLVTVFLILPLIPSLRGSEIVGLREHQLWAWLYGVNVYLSMKGGWVLSYVEHFWSLAVEEHFYFVWPLVVWWLRARPGALMRVALSVAALAFGGRVAASLAGVSLVTTTVLTPYQLDALLLGGFFALCLRQPGGVAAVGRAIKPMAVVAAVILLLQFGLHRFTDSGLSVMRALRSGAFHLLFAVLLLKAVLAPAASLASRFWRSSPMVTLGKYSYGLYVYHHFFSYYFVRHGVEFALARVIGSHTLAVAAQAIGGVAASMTIAWLSYEWFEKHFLRLKRFWSSAKAKEATDLLAARPRRA
ncbi:MAG TPA: acyltransferase [Anaeromyxobacteraceae bacterium]|nr:acyltransferase [Anaeromyxobacteraceae bacterium]